MSGSLDKSIIRRYIRKKVAAVRHCYEKALVVDPKLAGRLVLSFQINSDGTVSDVKASGFGNEEVDACVAEQIASIKFPSTNDGSIIKVSYPFNFQPADE